MTREMLMGIVIGFIICAIIVFIVIDYKDKDDNDMPQSLFLPRR